MLVALGFCSATDAVPTTVYKTLANACRQHVFQHVSQLSEAVMYKTSCGLQHPPLHNRNWGQNYLPCVSGIILGTRQPMN